MDLNGVEQIQFNALGGADNVVVNDLSHTSVTEVDIDLAATIGGSTGDGQADTVIVNGTNGNDTVDVHLNGTFAAVIGLHALVSIANLEGANDQLVINGLGGDDTDQRFERGGRGHAAHHRRRRGRRYDSGQPRCRQAAGRRR